MPNVSIKLLHFSLIESEIGSEWGKTIVGLELFSIYTYGNCEAVPIEGNDSSF